MRIIRACAEMGIRSVAIYADADRYSLHIKKADEAYSLGPDPVVGYLNSHRIVNLALQTGCDAIHPGYGFLSENAEFAAACERRGVTFRPHGGGDPAHGRQDRGAPGGAFAAAICATPINRSLPRACTPRTC